MNSDVFLFNPELRRPGCPILAAALGANPSFAHHFDSRTWIIDGDGMDGLRRFGPMTHPEVREIARRLDG